MNENTEQENKEEVAIIENNIAHNSENPKEFPVNIQVVTVPGPIKAAATKTPGPTFLNIYLGTWFKEYKAKVPSQCVPL